MRFALRPGDATSTTLGHEMQKIRRPYDFWETEDWETNVTQVIWTLGAGLFTRQRGDEAEAPARAALWGGGAITPPGNSAARP